MHGAGSDRSCHGLSYTRPPGPNPAGGRCMEGHMNVVIKYCAA